MGAAATLGATYRGQDQCDFLVWAPRAEKVEVHLLGPEDRYVPLSPGGRGYHHGRLVLTRPPGISRMMCTVPPRWWTLTFPGKTRAGSVWP